MLINVCPAAVTSVSPDAIWNLLTTPEGFGSWNDAIQIASEPPGPMQTDQVIHLAARALGRRWPLEMKVRDVDPQQRWIEVDVELPFGIQNHERLTLTETDHGTLLRLN